MCVFHLNNTWKISPVPLQGRAQNVTVSPLTLHIQYITRPIIQSSLKGLSYVWRGSQGHHPRSKFKYLIWFTFTRKDISVIRIDCTFKCAWLIAWCIHGIRKRSSLLCSCEVESASLLTLRASVLRYDHVVLLVNRPTALVPPENALKPAAEVSISVNMPRLFEDWKVFVEQRDSYVIQRGRNRTLIFKCEEKNTWSSRVVPGYCNFALTPASNSQRETSAKDAALVRKLLPI